MNPNRPWLDLFREVDPHQCNVSRSWQKVGLKVLQGFNGTRPRHANQLYDTGNNPLTLGNASHQFRIVEAILKAAHAARSAS
jgi:hypothetical protein